MLTATLKPLPRPELCAAPPCPEASPSFASPRAPEASNIEYNISQAGDYAIAPLSQPSNDNIQNLPVATPIDQDRSSQILPIEQEESSQTIVDGIVVMNENRPKKPLEYIAYFFIITGIVIITLIASGAFSYIAKSTQYACTTSSLPMEDFDFDSYVKEIAVEASGEDALNNSTTVQYQTYKIVAETLPSYLSSGCIKLDERSRITQRYIIALIHMGATSDIISRAYASNQLAKPTHECSNSNIACNKNAEVTAIFLDNREHKGWGNILVTEIGLLSQLEQLSVTNNALKGTLPSEIGNLLHLRTLDLKKNRFSGTIPTQIRQLHNLELIDLSSNLLEKTIPTNVESLKRLEFLDLSSNKLSGSIPTELVSLDELKGLRLYNNSLRGNLEYFCGRGSNVGDDEEMVINGEKEIFSYNLKTGWIIGCG